MDMAAGAAGVTRRTARRWWLDDPLLVSFDEGVLIALCDLFGVQPGELLEYVGEGD